MKLKESFFYTLREDAKGEESKSGNLLVRSGMIKKSSSGVYMYMPLGLKILKKIENIIREEMNQAGASEVLMPSLILEEVYEKSGRRAAFGNDMFSLKDRFSRNYVLGPTHEELFVEAAKMKIRSYKDMPFNLYQIATKYRDEPRPRYGLIRVREFLMKDAYSFDKDLKGLDISYTKMFEAYKRIYNRLQIDYRIVKADTGTMGGLLSEEFQAVTDIGEDTLVLCSSCDYASNIEVSECVFKQDESSEEILPIEKIYTKGKGTISELSSFLNINPNKMVKTLIYKIDGSLHALLLPGDRDVNETKVVKLLGALSIELASKEEVQSITQAKVGFVGPIHLSIPIIMDESIRNMKNFLVGANENDFHYKNVNLKDFNPKIIADIKNVKEGDGCPHCNKHLIFKKGIEIGNTFKLGTKYSESMGLYFTDPNNQMHPVMMGCYGMGLGRIMAAIAEQNHDENGFIWPKIIAPFSIGIIALSKEDEVIKASENLYEKLKNENIDVVLDDRNESAGVKFKDLDLIGVPYRIVIGSKVKDGNVEIKSRDQKVHLELPITDVIRKVKDLLS